MTAEPPVDLAFLMEALDGDEEAIRDLAATLLADSPPRLDELRGALTARDGRRVERAAHALKSALAAFGAEDARRLAAALEAIGRENRLDGGRELLTCLEREFERLAAYLTGGSPDPAPALPTEAGSGRAPSRPT